MDECKPLPPQPTTPTPVRPNPRPHTKLSSAARLPAGPTCHPRPAPPHPQSVPRTRARQILRATSHQAIQRKKLGTWQILLATSHHAIQRKKQGTWQILLAKSYQAIHRKKLGTWQMLLATSHQAIPRKNRGSTMRVDDVAGNIWQALPRRRWPPPTPSPPPCPPPSC